MYFVSTELQIASEYHKYHKKNKYVYRYKEIFPKFADGLLKHPYYISRKLFRVGRLGRKLPQRTESEDGFVSLSMSHVSFD